MTAPAAAAVYGAWPGLVAWDVSSLRQGQDGLWVQVAVSGLSLGLPSGWLAVGQAGLMVPVLPFVEEVGAESQGGNQGQGRGRHA